MCLLVVLGAGFDSRPYRLGALAETPIYEVDHPATQTQKRRALQRTLHTIPTNVPRVTYPPGHLGAVSIEPRHDRSSGATSSDTSKSPQPFLAEVSSRV